MIHSLRSYLLLLVFLGLAACGTSEDDIQIEEPVDVLYNKAADSLDEGNYFEATKYFEEVERQHPYSKWATQAQLMAAFSSYQDQRYDEAILALDRFIELHPGNPDIDYAYYLKALSYYEQISDVRRDQEMTKQARDALNVLISRFPQSKYARDAVLKRDLAEDHLAGKEMEVGRYYLGQGQVNAAINRFQTVIGEYQTTTHVPEALHRLVECYLTLGLKQQAARIASVLGYNYPGSKWYERSYALLDDEMRAQIDDERGLVERTLDSILTPE
ncbi:MAG: outer membrane protein assembly factor BamD [Alphaproteobacteria bacterium]|nr:outer membrane protein assembly factor BamD [Alphaproteobacteria bacterium]MCD8519806.1 outer membrane protein assembly factor BamD [Alphaproteobacteria bacterium]MCD8525625.1 outer membrane protein assembly factor BamD [Alphaproteobacteria bacterium]MCD8569999.1 outer membrane protein assembly factor BamD [Alphaproteobacteria bacterium]